MHTDCADKSYRYGRGRAHLKKGVRKPPFAQPCFSLPHTVKQCESSPGGTAQPNIFLRSVATELLTRCPPIFSFCLTPLQPCIVI